MKKYLFLFILPVLMLQSGCRTAQESNLIGIWILTRMDALPGEYPYEEWEFTTENDIIRYKVTEVDRQLLTTGRWGFTKRNRLNFSNFDVGFNGEWEVLRLDGEVLRIVLPVEVNGNPAGQVLREFSRAR